MNIRLCNPYKIVESVTESVARKVLKRLVLDPFGFIEHVVLRVKYSTATSIILEICVEHCWQAWVLEAAQMWGG